MVNRADLAHMAIDGEDLEFIDRALGQMRYIWQAGDLTAGDYIAEVKVTLQGGAVMTIPGDDWYFIHVRGTLKPPAVP